MAVSQVNPPSFDRIARPYRWLEYLSFGTALERCRFSFLGDLEDSRHALVLGDGDGRFTARLLAANPQVQVMAIDSSSAMLDLLQKRVEKLGPAAVSRLQTQNTDALAFRPAGLCFDAVVTHFFLDCLSEPQIAALIDTLQPTLVPGTTWLVSDFALPSRGPMAFLSKAVVGSLYLAFRILTGLKAHRLPGYDSLLQQAGFDLEQKRFGLRGLVVSEVWRLKSNV